MRRIAQVLILIVLIVLIIPVFLPNQVQAEAEKEFDFPAGIIFEDFNNFNEFSKWDPWTFDNEQINKEFFSPYRGKGAGYKWNFEKEHGDLTITKSEPNQTVEYKMNGFSLSEHSEMKVEFFAKSSTKTLVKWSVVSDKLDYFSRYYTYFTSEKINEKLKQGLQNLERELNTSSLTSEQAQALPPDEIMREKFDGQKLLVVQNLASLDEDEINTATEESMGLIYSYMVDYLKVSPSVMNKPVTYYEYIDSAKKETKFFSGYPLNESVKPGESMELFSIPAGETLVCIHKGSYSTLPKTLDLMRKKAKKDKLKLGNSYWEEYLNDPETVKNENELLTKIYIPIKN